MNKLYLIKNENLMRRNHFKNKEINKIERNICSVLQQVHIFWFSESQTGESQKKMNKMIWQKKNYLSIFLTKNAFEHNNMPKNIISIQ